VGVVFTSKSVMEFDSMEDLRKVVALMPWTPDQKESFLQSGEQTDEDEAEFSFGTVYSKHKFTFEEK